MMGERVMDMLGGSEMSCWEEWDMLVGIGRAFCVGSVTSLWIWDEICWCSGSKTW